jgi:putative SOS response-associated peptidase YedK
MMPDATTVPVVLNEVESWLDVDVPLAALNPLGPDRFAVRPVNRAVNKVSEKDIEAIEAPPD